MEIARGIHHFQTDPFNWYVIEEAGRLTLVDAGFPGHYATFTAGLRSLGKTVKDIEAIVLTHSHADHTGFAQRVSVESGAPVWIHRDDVGRAAQVLELPWYGLLSNAWRPFVAGMLTRAMINGAFTMPRVPNARALTDGQRLDIPGRPEVIHVPGHTPGQIALHLPDRGVLFSSDAIVTQNLFTGASGTPQVPGRLLNDNDAMTRRSLDRLSDLGPVTMLTGHGPMWRGEVREAVEMARRG